MPPSPSPGAFAMDSSRNGFGADTGSSRRTRNTTKNTASSMDVLARQSDWVSFSDDRSSTSAFGSTSSWMGRPVDCDASWLPVAPPTQTEETPETRNDDANSSRHSEGESRNGGERKDRLPPSGRPSQRPRPRSVARSQSVRSNSRNDNNSNIGDDFSSHFESSSSGGTEKISRSHTAEQESRSIGRTSRHTPPRSSRSSSGGSQNSRRSKDKSSRAETDSSHHRDRSSHRSRSQSPGPNRGRTLSSTSNASSRASRSRSSRRRTPDDRGRSRSRSSSRTPVTGPHARRSRSMSRTVDNTGRSARSRSASRSGARSSGRNLVTDRQARKSRSLSRTPLPGERSRSRSTSRSTRNKVKAARSEGRPTSRAARVPSGSSNSIGPGLPPRQKRAAVDDASASAHTMDARIGSEVSFGMARQLSLRATPINGVSPVTQGKRKEGGIMEKLFGDHVGPSNDMSSSAASITSSVRSSTQQLDCIHPRVLLSATVYHNSATNLWITTINTNQKGVATNQAAASKHLKAFSFKSEREARESAIANAPPKMIPFDDCPNCFVCNGKFAVFRRASHCRNCGVCVCNSCSTTWPSKMIPETYNLKKESSVKICKSCHVLSMDFKKTLLSGDYEGTVALYGMGNINLRCPFPNARDDKKGETMYPIHAAVEGGNLNLVRWLIDDHFCPIKMVRARNSKKGKRRGRGRDAPILTSNGRSVFSIAMAGLKIDIMRYLVVKKGVSVYEIKDLKAALRSLEATLIALPHRDDHLLSAEIQLPRIAQDDFSDSQSETCSSSLESLSRSDNSDGSPKGGSRRPHEKEEKLSDACILCYENNIDCVITPCGHQICCLECSSNLSSCPVCNAECQFIRIFKP